MVMWKTPYENQVYAIPLTKSGTRGVPCNEMHSWLSEDEAGDRPLRCGLWKDHTGDHVDSREIDVVKKVAES